VWNQDSGGSFVRMRSVRRRKGWDVKSLVGLDVVVIGAGAIGVSTAYFLQKAGMRVTLLEHAMNADLSRLDVRGDHTTEHGFSSSLNCHGTRLLAEVISDLGHVFQRNNNSDFTSLNPSVAVPAIRCSESGAEIHADSVLKEIMCAIKDRGGRVFDDVEIADLVICAGNVVGVNTNKGQFLGDEVVISSATLSSKFEFQYNLDFGPQHYQIVSASNSEKNMAWDSRCVTSELSYVGRPDELSGAIVALGLAVSPQLAFMVGEKVAKMVSRPWEESTSASYPPGRLHLDVCL
jgi:hypothetical protein